MDNLYGSENDILFPEENCLPESSIENKDTGFNNPENEEADVFIGKNTDSITEEETGNLVCGEYGNMFYQNENINYDKNKDICHADYCTIDDNKNNKTDLKLKRKAKEMGNRDTLVILAAFLISWLILPWFLSVMLPPKNNTGQTEIMSGSGKDFKIQESRNNKKTIYSTVEIAEKCSPSVVAITTLSKNEVMTFFGTYEQESEGAGSGVIIGETEEEILIVTNYHVIQDADVLTICLNDDTGHPYSASVKGSRKDYDIAVVSVKKDDLADDSSITTAVIGNSGNAKVGEQVVAIGNALGLGQSVTAGIVSAKDRQVSSGTASIHAIQTDAAINPGNSGGGLFNVYGELVGINNAKYTDASVEGMGFAIPVSDIKDIIEELASQKTHGADKNKKGYLGISAGNLRKEYLQYFNAPYGAFVADIEENGAAWNAGIRKSDIITEVEGTKIISAENLADTVTSYEAGHKIKVKYTRMENGEFKEYTTKVTLQAKAEEDKEEDVFGDGIYSYPQIPDQNASGVA